MAEELILSVDLDTAQADKTAKTLEGSLKEIGAVYAKAFTEGDKVQEKLAQRALKAAEAYKKQEVQVQKLREQQGRLLSGAETPKSIKQYENQVKKAEKELDVLIEKQISAASKMEDLDFGINTDELKVARAEVASLEAEIDKARTNLERVKGNGSYSPSSAIETKNIGGNLGLAEQKLARLDTEFKRTAAAATKTDIALKRWPHSLQKAISAFGNVGRVAAKTMSAVSGGVKNAFGKTQKDASNFSKAASQMFSRLKGIILSAFIFNAAAKGLRELAGYISDVAKTNTGFMTSLQMAKGNLLTAFQPIVSVIMPILNTLGAGLQYITGLFVQFMSVLSGQSVQSMQAGAKGLDKQTKAMKGTGKAAKDAGKQLASFDEIQKLSANSSGGDTGGSGSGGFEPIFEISEVKLPKWIGGIIDDIKRGDWSSVGTTIATQLNSVINKLDGGAVGKKIGGFLQNAFEVGLSFWRTIDTGTIGKEIGNLVSGAFSALNPETVGATFGAYWSRILDFFSGIISNIKWNAIGDWLGTAFTSVFAEYDWAKLGNTVSDFVKGVLGLISSFVIKTDWGLIGKSVFDMLAGIDWGGVVSELALLIGAAIGGLAALLFGFFSDSAKEIGEYFAKAIEAAGGDIGLGLLLGILNALNNIAKWIHDNIAVPIINGVKKAFGIHSPSVVFAEIGKMLIMGLFNGISNMLSKISEVIGKIKDMFTNGFKGVFNGIMDIVEKAVNWIIRALNKISFSIPDWVPEWLGGGKKFGISLSAIKLPRLAQGAVIPPNREFMAVLGDQKSGMNIEAPEGLIRKIMREEMSDSGGSSQDININFSGSMAQFVRMLKPQIERETRRRGTNAIKGGI